MLHQVGDLFKLNVKLWCQKVNVYCATCFALIKVIIRYYKNTYIKIASNCSCDWLSFIIIWHYNPLWVFAFSARSLQVLSLAASFQFLTFSFFRSSMTSSCHHCLGFPTGLVPIGFQTSSFLVGLACPFFGYAPAIWFFVP